MFQKRRKSGRDAIVKTVGGSENFGLNRICESGTIGMKSSRGPAGGIDYFIDSADDTAVTVHNGLSFGTGTFDPPNWITVTRADN